MFGEGLRTRLRPDYFPFTEPSAEVDMECFVCRGAVGEPGRPAVPHLPVARAGSSWAAAAWSTRGCWSPAASTPSATAGFAFGLGIERTLMFRHGVEDIRDMVEGDVRFTLPFGMEI